MGQNASCLRSEKQHDDFIDHQKRIYRWRADPRTNAYLPRVSIVQDQQFSKHRFAKFIQDSSYDYLRIDDFQQGESKEGDILLFEKFAFTLGEVEALLSASEAAYVLSSLSLAFRGLLEEFGRVVVNRNCWFVTAGGQVRAWINRDPRCNFIDLCSDEQQFGVKDCKGIAFKLLSETLKCCEESTSVLALFKFVRQSIEKKEGNRVELFEFIRERINYYIGQTGLPSCNSIEFALNRKTRRTTSISKTNVNASVVATKPEVFKSGLNETRMTWDNQRSIHCKSKSVESANSQLIRSIPFRSIIDHTPSSLITKNQLLWHHNSAFSNIIKTSQIVPIVEQKPINEIALLKYSEISSTSQVMKVSESLQPTQKPKPIIKLSECEPSRTQYAPVQLQTSRNSNKIRSPNDSRQMSLQNDVLISQNLLTEQDPNMQLIDTKQSHRQNRISKFSKNSRNKMERKVSILQFENQNSHERHVQTFHQVHTNHVIQEETVQFPWKTNKTITRLINDDTDSLVHSIGSSSEQNNFSSYSGVLTHMGRDITKKDIISNSSHSQINQ